MCFVFQDFGAETRVGVEWPRGAAALAIRRLGSLPGKQAQKRVAGQCPPDRGAASIRAKDRIVAAASDGDLD